MPTVLTIIDIVDSPFFISRHRTSFLNGCCRYSQMSHYTCCSKTYRNRRIHPRLYFSSHWARCSSDYPFSLGLRRHRLWLATRCWHVQSRFWARSCKMGPPALVCLSYFALSEHIYSQRSLSLLPISLSLTKKVLSVLSKPTWTLKCHHGKFSWNFFMAAF